MKKQWKSISIDKEIYNLVKAKQEELMKKNNGDYVEISYVAEQAILEGIDKVLLVNKEYIKKLEEIQKQKGIKFKNMEEFDEYLIN